MIELGMVDFVVIENTSLTPAIVIVELTVVA
jgi:hypothetical protein